MGRGQGAGGRNGGQGAGGRVRVRLRLNRRPIRAARHDHRGSGQENVECRIQMRKNQEVSNVEEGDRGQRVHATRAK